MDCKNCLLFTECTFPPDVCSSSKLFYPIVNSKIAPVRTVPVGIVMSRAKVCELDLLANTGVDEIGLRPGKYNLQMPE